VGEGEGKGKGGGVVGLYTTKREGGREGGKEGRKESSCWYGMSAGRED